MSEVKRPDDLDERVLQFQMMKLPGQPIGMHMGTSYLVNDLHKRVKELEAENQRLREAISIVYEAWVGGTMKRMRDKISSNELPVSLEDTHE